MKKIIYTLLVAVLAFSFMGCPSVYEDLKFEEKVPTPAYIQGDMTDNKAVAMEVDGDVATYTFKYSVKDHNAWNGEPGTVNFKVSPEKDGDGLNWPLAWSNAKLTLNGEAVVVTEQNTSNISCSGLADGEEYTIKVTAGVKSVKIEVTGKEGAAAPVLYVIDPSKGLVKMTYDGEKYQYEAKAESDSIKLKVWTADKYLKGTYALGTVNASNLTIEDEINTVDITGVTSGNKYYVYITYDGEKATVKAEEKPSTRLYMIGDLTSWNFTELTTTDEVYYTGTVTTTSNSSAFCITNKADWTGATTYRGVDGALANIAVGTEITLENFNHAVCAPVTGLKADTKYFITVKFDAENDTVTLQFSETKPLWIIGTITDWAFELMSMEAGNYTFDFTASESDNICITDGPAWSSNTYRKTEDNSALESWKLDNEVSFFAGDHADCPGFTGTNGSKYSITASYDAENDVVKAKATKK